MSEPMWRESVNRPDDYLVGHDDTLVGYEDDGGEAFINLLFGTVPFEPVEAAVVLSVGAGLASDAQIELIAGVADLMADAPIALHVGRSGSEQAAVVLSVGAGLASDAQILIWNGASFEWEPDLSQIVETVRYQTRVTRFESGREQRRARGTGRREWQLRFQRDDVDAAAIWDFYLDRQGVVRGFWWRNPLDGKTHLVRFADQIMTMETMWRVLYRMGLRIVEVKP